MKPRALTVVPQPAAAPAAAPKAAAKADESYLSFLEDMKELGAF